MEWDCIGALKNTESIPISLNTHIYTYICIEIAHIDNKLEKIVQ